MSTVFGGTERTQQVMIPTDLILEYIDAYKAGQIDVSMKPRTMRDIVKVESPWANYQHGFETHVHAVVVAWATRFGESPT